MDSINGTSLGLLEAPHDGGKIRAVVMIPRLVYTRTDRVARVRHFGIMVDLASLGSTTAAKTFRGTRIHETFLD